MTEAVEIRVCGERSLPALVYLPGLHGDWTLIGAFRKAVEGRVRFLECTYPRTLTWSLEDYATGIEEALASANVNHGWLLAESFGSQVAWPVLARDRFQADGLILAGGFGRHPMRSMVRAARRIGGSVPLGLITSALFGYARIARFKHRQKPEVLAALDAFLERRTELDRKAAIHRLELIATNDPINLATNIRTPVYAITGSFDPIVPWGPARKWLRKNCANLRDYRIVRADHAVLNTASRASAECVLGWMGV